MTITLNGIDVFSVKLNIPWRGVWEAECELDAPDIAAATLLTSSPLPALLSFGAIVFTGTIDTLRSGTFVNRIKITVVGGRNGWGKILPGQEFVSPAGALLSTAVFAATGAQVGEVVLDPIPSILGEHFTRTKGPASDIFVGRDWHVDPITSGTLVGPWPPLPLDPTASIGEYDPVNQVLTVFSDNPVLPGALIVDTDGRLNGKSLTVRDVEMTIGPEGSFAVCRTGASAVSRDAAVLTNIIKSSIDTRHLKAYRYRLILMASDQLILQGISGDAPDLNPIDQWTGLSGAKARLTPGTEIMVAFAEGDARYPYLVAFSPLAIPLEIDLGPLPFPLAFAAPVVTAFAAIATYVAALTAALAANPTSYTLFAAAMAAPGATLAAALAGLSATVPTVIVKGT